LERGGKRVWSGVGGAVGSDGQGGKREPVGAEKVGKIGGGGRTVCGRRAGCKLSLAARQRGMEEKEESREELNRPGNGQESRGRTPEGKYSSARSVRRWIGDDEGGGAKGWDGGAGGASGQNGGERECYKRGGGECRVGNEKGGVWGGGSEKEGGGKGRGGGRGLRGGGRGEELGRGAWEGIKRGKGGGGLRVEQKGGLKE